jgi:NADPH:quinone reductase
MRAVVARSGRAHIIEASTPAVGLGQVRVRAQAAAVNPVDLATLSGALTEAGLLESRPETGIGWDVAGIVDEAGPLVTRFVPGEPVIGLSDRLDIPLGTHAEFVVLDEDAVAHAPTGVSAVEAATLPLNGLTAAQALDLLDLKPGGTLLVTGAAGAVGGFAVEIAAARGLRVVATAGRADETLVRGLGADLFVPRSDDLPAAVRALVAGGVDAVIDAAVIGPRALEAVRGGGAYVSVFGATAPQPLRGTRVLSQWIRADGAQLAELVDLVDKGKLTLRVAGTHPLSQAPAAYDRLSAERLRGRLVLVP